MQHSLLIPSSESGEVKQWHHETVFLNFFLFFVTLTKHNGLKFIFAKFSFSAQRWDFFFFKVFVCHTIVSVY